MRRLHQIFFFSNLQMVKTGIQKRDFTTLHPELKFFGMVNIFISIIILLK